MRAATKGGPYEVNPIFQRAATKGGPYESILATGLGGGLVSARGRWIFQADREEQHHTRRIVVLEQTPIPAGAVLHHAWIPHFHADFDGGNDL